MKGAPVLPGMTSLARVCAGRKCYLTLLPACLTSFIKWSSLRTASEGLDSVAALPSRLTSTTTTLALLLTILTSTWERRRGYQGVEDTEGEDAVEDGEDAGGKKARKCKDRRLTGKSIPAARVLLIQVLLGGKADCSVH